MDYITESLIEQNSPSWPEVLNALEGSIQAIQSSSYAQPLKPYLRFGDPKNRIIAMPAFVGGHTNACGIKWISSFPDNYLSGLPRAHALIILNETSTGVPIATMESNLLSAMRTAGVSGLILKHFFKTRENVTLGFSGFGFIAKTHLEMIQSLFLNKISKINIFDQRKIDPTQVNSPNIQIDFSKTWEEAYEACDVFLTCTTTSAPYICLPPKENSLHIDVSLRDYQPEIVKSFDRIVVDDWDEVCRENTDIERAHLSWGLEKSSTIDLPSFLLSPPSFSKGTTFFAPMGMAIFDIALASTVYQYLKQGKLRSEGHG